MKVKELLPLLHMTVIFKWFDEKKYDFGYEVCILYQQETLDSTITKFGEKEIIRIEKNDCYDPCVDRETTKASSFVQGYLVLVIK